ncbi:hypothetical protein GH714_005410 [Hevea brasiliensis]|uniref:mannan endo-1,4-beta-mannosidase n=1 Tax=Hevea brasiliensis TaxID=3981 RepID=A0A6A6LYY7_HEVBR|nr:hypothetical protein GH714_005410 [Hevea brasiliensis]
MGFVSTNSTQFFIINGGGDQDLYSPLYINGWNSYWLMEESVWTSSRSKVSKMLKRGSQMGLTVCRTWAFSDGHGPNGLQLSPGVFNERAFQGLDFVIVEARKHGIRLILSLVNNLNAFGGKDQYVRWAQEAGINVSSSDDSFFSNPTIKDYYKAYVKAWITEMAAFIKSLDKKHLVTVGVEGFYGLTTSNKTEVNPGKWAALLGSDFIQNSAVENIDFASVHTYPDSWIPSSDLKAKANFLSLWVDSHISDGDFVLRKPVLLTEVGSTRHVNKKGVYDTDADVFLKMVYDRIYDSAKKRQAGAGALIWQLLVEGVEEYSDQFSFVPWHYPSTYKLIEEQSYRLRSVFAKSSKDGEINRRGP